MWRITPGAGRPPHPLGQPGLCQPAPAQSGLRLPTPTTSRILTAMTDPQLIQRIRETALLQGEFTLRSGRKSNYYLDKYFFETQPDILAALGERLAAYARDEVDRLAGAELGGIPLVCAASLASGKPAVLVRNQKKGYGSDKQLEGRLEPGDRVLLVEDVVTTGGQIIEAARSLRACGGSVVRVVAVIDRLEGARQNIEQAGLGFTSLFTKADLGIGG